METAQGKKKEESNKPKQPTALVVGGAGFVGSHLCETLVSQNFQVICVDNLSTGKKENLKDILTAPNFTFIEADINEPNFHLGKDVKIDYCFHLASIEDYRNNKNISLDTLLVNSLGTRQLLEIAKENQAKFILFSSADLYSGAISTSSLRYYFGKSPEGEEVLSALEAKRFSEALTFEYFKKFNLSATVIRLKDVYGPRMNLDRGDEIANLLKSAINKEDLVIYGDGLKTFNPTYISDVIFGSVKASLGDFSGEIFILVNGEKVTLESFAQTVKLVAGPLNIEHKKSLESFDLPTYHLDLENTREKLNWKPKVGLAEGIAAFLQNLQIVESGKKEKVDEEFKEEISKVVKIKEEKQKVRKVKKTPLSFWLRLTIFGTSLLLLSFTVFYPISSLVTNSFFGTRNLTDSSTMLELNNNQEASKAALAAQNNFVKAEQNLQNINWLLKIIGLNGYSANLDRFFEAVSSLAEAVSNISKSNEILISTSNKSTLGPKEAKEKLEEARILLSKAQENLEKSQLNQEVIDWKKIPPFLPDQSFFSKHTATLSREVETVLVVIDKSLIPESP